ncbi:MAG: hypothetical protein REI09_04840 [Candidatus Dactylopiibacterium sp.]|nr:hypothetical protein [Candidatus Dactylopiibacterium sp.]
MKIGVTALLLGLLSSALFAQSAPTAPARIKAGDKVRVSVQTYAQEDAFSPPALRDKRLAATYLVESDDGTERVLKYANDNRDVYDKRAALVAVIRNGVRKDLAPAGIKHWKPAGELAPGMKWSFTTLESSPATNAPEHICDFDGAYQASSSGGVRVVNIDGKPARLTVVVVDVEGRLNWRGCDGSALRVKERYVYSADLDLLLERDTLHQDPFGKMLGGSGNLMMKVTAVTTAAPAVGP